MSGHRPRVKREQKYEYTDKLAKKKRTFTPVTDEVVATFEEQVAPTVAETLSARDDSAVNTVSLDRGFAILRVGVNGADIAHMVDSVESEDQVANVIPVFEDDEGGRRYFLPDELTVQFEDEVAASDAEEILDREGMVILTKQRTPGYYTVGVPEGKGLFESIGALSKLDEVLFAEPSEVGLDDLLAGAKGASPGRTAPRAQVAAAMEELELEDLDIDGFAHELDLESTRGNGSTLFLEPQLEDAPVVDDATAVPSDPFFGRLWGLHNIGQSVNGTMGTSDADIDATHAWNLETGSKRVVCAVIDTGCDLDHPDLKANILPRGSEDWDFADPADGEPWDSGTHGTHVAGTVGARRNGQGVVGVAYGVWLMPLRVNLTSGMNQNRADAINYVTQQAIKYKRSRRYVVNCSWRMRGDHAGVRLAIQKAVQNNVVVVFAAGNDNRNTDVDPQYPGVYPEVISVAATDQSDQRAWFSNFGKNVDVAAPGVNIYSTIPDNTYGFKNGTSMAAPHVAGLAALIWSKNPYLTNNQVRKCIEGTCDNIDAKNPGFGGLLGAGRINAYRALRHCQPPRIRYRILHKFKFPQKNAGSSTGLSFVPDFGHRFLGRRRTILFLTQQAGTERIFFMDATTGAVLRTVDPQANDTIGSLSWDGSAIRVANVTTGAGSINRINPWSGAQISSIAAPAGRGEGLVSVGRRRLFYSTITHIHELDATTGVVIRSFPAPGGECRALAYGRRLLFSANSTTGRITVFNPWTMDIRGHLNAPGAGSRQAEGLAFDARRKILFVANQTENRIYCVRLNL